MREKPFEPLLHRELHARDAKNHYAVQIVLLRDVVNYGTNLVPSCLASSGRTLGDVVITTVLLKQVVLMLDALEVLAGEACSEALVLQARAMFEASVYLEWMLREDKERKALYYYVANVRKERQWVKRGIEDDPEQEAFFRNLGEFGNALTETRSSLATIAPPRLAEIDSFLAKEPYAAINADFEREKGNRPFEPSWHTPLGESSVRSVAKAVGRLHEYEIFYTHGSETMHVSRHTRHVKIKKGRIELEPIRHLEGLKTTLLFSLSVAFHTYRVVLGHYRPGQLDEFNRRYVQDWRSAFMNIPTVNYQESKNQALI
jgi:hypothetical protein